MKAGGERWAGWGLLAWAVGLERTVAAQKVWLRHQARRNAALHGAWIRGVPVDAMAKWVGLPPDYVKRLAKNGKSGVRGEAGGASE